MNTSRRPWLALLVLVVASWAHCPAARATEPSDDEIRGYARAVLEREFNVRPEAVTVQDGVVHVEADLPDSERAKLKRILADVRGVKEVEITSGHARRGGFFWLPIHSQFRPLIADPRWPDFSAAYQYYLTDQFTNVNAVSMGETFGLVRYSLANGDILELGIQGGIFAIFDLDSSSFDLVNADYLAAIPFTYATGNFSAMLRLLHQSSHLGDEYLLHNPGVTRINLSYEDVNLLASYEVNADLRLYGGVAYIFESTPDLRPWSLQAGGEYVARQFTLPLSLEPVAAVDLQFHEEGGWAPNLSLRLGVQYPSPFAIARDAQLLWEFYDGKSPNGQFYTQTVAYTGLVAQIHF